MASGTLPMGTYHRTQSLGAGTFGSVCTVYNDDGEEFAMKLFLDDEDENEEEGDQTLQVGALLEISVLRLLRDQNRHVNIVTMFDVRGAEGYYYEEEEGEAGAGTAGCLAMTMPLYPLGSLDQAIESKAMVQSRPVKIRIAHGLLSAVNYLHENGIMHRDIKTDNVMLAEEPDGSIRPVLIDFSLAKIVNASMYGDPENCFLTEDEEPTTHTGQAGTATYMSPEVHMCEPYGLSCDLWSAGVVLLELLKTRTLQAVKATQAEKLVQEALQSLPDDKPFPILLRNLLRKDPSERWTARQALEKMSSTLFTSIKDPIPPVKIINIKEALPFDDEENVAPIPDNSVKKNKTSKKKVVSVLERRKKKVKKLCDELECEHPMTINASLCYCQRMLQLDDELDDLSSSQTMLDCVLLAHKVFEVDMLDLTEVHETYSSFADWSLDEYQDNEATLLMMMDHCLFPRELIA
jgi:serine/threonine protein kinase